MASSEVGRARTLLAHLVSEPEATMDDYRRLYDEVLANFELPGDAEVEEVDAGGAAAIWVSAPGTARDQVVVLVHGGGWCMGNAKGYREFGYRISASADARVLVVDYRLAPENPFPAPVDDVVAAYRWAREQEGVRRVALVGDSAGGGLVVSALVKLRDDGGPLPNAAVVCSPLVDLAGEGASLTDRAHLDPLPAKTLVEAMGGAYRGGVDPKNPLASPLYADLSGLPPLRVLVGTDEGLHDDSVRLVDKVRAAGGEAELEIGEGLVHIWPIFNFLPEAQASTERIGEFLRKRFANPA
ncbi:alpha/beta hydrolase [Amycolatopsis thermalba]|uniref:Alpha/beta hydrolase n=1 Tax=Amycolatopsis thermalba TaxID=944492 RepID=A0ABY4NXH9_9PSEU|nr:MULTISPECIES: alpha/beta hydrolase [Amycolatopsis]UQS24787.1 alpha/beta hydrolase [Amycolatopsis thermalba]